MNEFVHSYHNHTSRCHHASGTDEEYVKAAIKGGLRLFGFSDHAPHNYFGDYASSVRMTPAELPEYCSSVRALKEKYKGEIDIRLGLEMEYFPVLFEKDLALYKECGVEYLILAQHFIGNESTPDKCDCYTGDDSQKRLTSYVDQCIAGLRTGVVSYYAHPDFLNFTGDLDFYESECDRLILAAKELSVPVEINLLGLSTGRHYPREAFFKRVARNSHFAVIGRDAHSPDRVNNQDELAEALRFADRCGVDVRDSILLKPL